MTVISASNARSDALLPLVAMLGGTFDPIHHGHLRTALELRDQLHCARVQLVPCHRPPHRGAPAQGADVRLQMVQLAVAGEPGLLVDDRELRSPHPSYSVDTLASLRAELGRECALAMVIGSDALLGLDRWHRWQELLQLAHIVVVRRPGWRLDPGHRLAAWVAAHQVNEVDALRRRPAGHLIWQEITSLAISATQIRDLLAHGRSPRYLIPDAVWAFIRERGLYGTQPATEGLCKQNS